MPLYLYEGRLLLSQENLLTAGQDCCCEQPKPPCTCCYPAYVSAFTVRVVGRIESAECNQAGLNPVDQCSSLNGDYVFWISEADCVSDGGVGCSIVKTLATGKSACNLTNIQARIEWYTVQPNGPQLPGGDTAITFSLGGTSSSNGQYQNLIFAELVDIVAYDCRMSVSLINQITTGCGLDISANIVFQPQA